LQKMQGGLALELNKILVTHFSTQFVIKRFSYLSLVDIAPLVLA
jgi:hypothetical protein